LKFKNLSQNLSNNPWCWPPAPQPPIPIINNQQRAPSSTAPGPTAPCPRSRPTPRAAASSTSSRRSSATTRRTTSARRTTPCRTGAFAIIIGNSFGAAGLFGRAICGKKNANAKRAAPGRPTPTPTPTPTPLSLSHGRPLSRPPLGTRRKHHKTSHSQQLNKNTRQLPVDLVDVKMFDGLLGATLEERPTDLLPLVRFLLCSFCSVRARRFRPRALLYLSLPPRPSPPPSHLPPMVLRPPPLSQRTHEPNTPVLPPPPPKKQQSPPNKKHRPTKNEKNEKNKKQKTKNNSSRSPPARSSRRTTSSAPTAAPSASATSRSSSAAARGSAPSPCATSPPEG